MLSIWQIIGIWVATALTLMMLSFLYRDNPFFRLAEHLYLGISNAYIIWFTWDQIIEPNFINRVFFPPSGTSPAEWQREPWYIIPGLLGILMLTRMFPKIAWLSRWALAFYVGYAAGVSIGPTLNSYILAQMYSTFPLTNVSFNANGVVNLPSLINSLLIFIGVVTVLVYFFFSYEHKGFIGKTARLGIWVLMIALGASFGSTVMARVSLFIGRARFLVQDAEPTYHAFSILLSLAVIIALVAYFLEKRKARPAQE